MRTGRDLAYEINDYLEEDGPFKNEDEVYSYINDAIDAALIYTKDIFEFAEYYCDDSQIINMMIDELIEDVYENISPQDYIKSEEEDEDEEE